jgi:hypothetical protein
MKDLLSIFFKDNSGTMTVEAPVRWLPVQYHDMGLPDGRPITVRFQAFDERELKRSHPRELDNRGDISMTLDAVAAVAAGTPAPAHADVPTEVAHAALQTVLARSRDTVPRFMGAHALGDDASRTAFLRDCTARGILLRDPGPRVEAALVV